YAQIKRQEVRTVIGDQLQADIPIEVLIAELQTSYDVYYVIPNLTSHWNNKLVQRRWAKLLGQNVLRLEEPAAICELIASTIGLAEGKIGLHNLGDNLQEAGASANVVGAVARALEEVGERTGITRL